MNNPGTPCPRCGHLNPLDTRLCGKCGQALQDQWGDPLYAGTPADVQPHPAQPLASGRRSGQTIAMLLALLVLGGVGYAVLAGVDTDPAPSPPSGVVATVGGGGCSPLERPALQEATHIEEGATHEPYSSDPPSSGPHYAVPADPGFFTTPLSPEQLVHNLEHGQVVIWYRPDLAPADLDALEGLTVEEPIATVTVPYAGIQAPDALVLTAWGALHRCQGVSVEDINAFRAQFQGRGPENVGVPTFEG